MPAKRYLGIDYGTKKLGIAISDADGRVAFPKGVVPNDHLLFKYLEMLCEKSDVAEVVMGESNDLKGTPNPVQSEILEFVHKLERILELEVHLEPEYLTTQQAISLLGRNKMTDASAAALILQTFLDRRNNVENKKEEH